MNNELRLILLIAGVAVLVAIYFWGNAAERTWRRRHTVLDDRERPGSPGWREDGEAPSFDDELPEFSDLESLYTDSHEPVPGRVAPTVELAQTHSATTARTAGIVALHVMCDGAPFEGPQILAAAKAADLIFGAMDIFHCYAEGPDRTRERVFSVADVHEPGSFNLENMAQFSTRGLSLFMCLPSPIGNRHGFERMYQAARIFSERLGGTVCGEDRQPLQAEQLAALRQSLDG